MRGLAMGEEFATASFALSLSTAE
jgi:hypothetical protein